MLRIVSEWISTKMIQAGNACHRILVSAGRDWLPILFYALLLNLNSPAFAVAATPAPTQLPTGGQVTAGDATITAPVVGPAGSTLNINQSSDRAAINWQTFDIGSAATVNFNQPSAQSVTLNHVLDANPSQIFGHLNANGQVFLSNPNGVYFAPGASVDVGGLVASTLSLSDEDFMAGKDTFTRNGSTGKVVNQGKLTAAPGGYIALLAPEVRNEGVIVANMGVVALAGGEAITLNFDPAAHLTDITVTPSQIKVLLENRTAIFAEGGIIILSARAVDALMASVVNSGEISASSMSNKGGKITIEADSVTLAATSKITATGATGGGTVLIGGAGKDAAGLAEADSVSMLRGSMIDASATENGDGGKVILWSNLADGKTVVQGKIAAKGAGAGNGGFVETSGHSVNFDGIRVDTTALGGTTGNWLTDPYDLTIDSGAATTVNTNLGTTNVTLQTTSSNTIGTLNASGNGDIFVNSALNWSSGNTLTLDAYRNISINAAISAGNNGKVVLVTGDTDANGVSDSTTGDYSFGLGSTGFAGNLTFGSTAGTASLSISTNNTALASYALVYTQANLAALNGTSTNYALAKSFATSGTYTSGTPGTATMIASFGDSSTHAGTFTGLGNSLSGFTIDDHRLANENGPGGYALFGTNYGTIRDFGVTGASITTNSFNNQTGTGLLVGINTGGKLLNDYSTGSITNSSGVLGTVGGLVGSMTGSTVTNSWSSAALSLKSSTAGGLVGSAATNTIISDSYATGVVSSTGGSTIGGLVGVLDGVGVSVTNSYATGSVSGVGSVGGLAGASLNGTSVSPTTISNSYATGTVTGTGDMVGGLVGDADSVTNISDSHANGNVTNINGDSTGGLVGYARGIGDLITITRSYATGSVTVTGTGKYVGGLVGSSVNTNIDMSFATGAVTATSYLGGLLGYSGGTTHLTDVYALGAVSGNMMVGGLAGYFPSNSTDIAINGYAAGKVTGTGVSPTYIGGTFGESYLALLTNIYWDSSPTGTNQSVGNGGTAGYTPTGGGALSTATLQNGTLPSGFNTNASSNSNPWSVTSGFYPYFTYQYPDGAQAISGHAYTSAGSAAASATVNLYVGGNMLSGGSRTTDSLGAYTALINGGSVTSSTPLGGTLILNGGGSTVVGATYLGAPVLTSGNITGFDLQQGVFLATTPLTTNSALQTSLGATFGSGTYSGLTTALSAGRWQYNATGDFTVDTAISHAGGDLGLSSGGDLSINNTLTAGTNLFLQAGDDLNENISGGLSAVNLVVSGGIAVLTGLANTVATFVATGVSSLNYKNSAALTVGSVASYKGSVTAANIKGTMTTTTGISAAGDITVAAGAGNLTVANNIGTTVSSGNATLTLKSADDLTINSGVSISTASSNKLNTVLWSNTDGTGQGAVSVTTGTITTNNGQFWLGGGSGSTTWNGLTVGDGYATSTSPSGTATGALLSGATISTGTGNIFIGGAYNAASNPSGTNYGVRILNTSLQSTSGDMDIDGQIGGLINQGDGTFIVANAGDTLLQTTSGDISIKGTGSDSVSTPTGNRLGVYLQAFSANNSLSVLSDSGSITIDGKANFANDTTSSAKVGVALQSQVETSHLTIASNSGDMTVKGTVASDSVSHTSRNAIWLNNPTDTAGAITIGKADATGDISIQANSIWKRNVQDGSGSVALLGTGDVTIAPTDGSFTALRSGTTAASTMTFDNDFDFGNAHSAITIGSSTNTLDFTVDGPLTSAGSITLAGGNLMTAALTATGNVTLNSTNGGTIAQTGAITAAGLNVLGSYMAILNNNDNDVDTFAAGGVGGLAYRDKDDVTIGTVGSSNGISTTGTILVETLAGDLTVTKNITTTDTSDTAIRLNAGKNEDAGTATGGNIVVSNNPTITTGTGGRATFYSGSATGDTSLGTLVGSGSSHFRYNSDETDSHFTTELSSGLYAIYREAIAIAADAVGITYGDTVSLTSNGVNGDDVDLSVTNPLFSSSSNIRAGSYGITVDNLEALAGLGYTTSGTTGATLSVEQKTLTVSGVAGVDRKYNGGIDVSVSTVDADFDGLIDGDEVTASGTIEDKNVEDDKAVSLSFAGTDSDNYNIGGQDSATVDISKATLKISTNDVTKTYDGTVGTSTGTDASGMLATVVDGTLYDGDSLTGGTFNYTDKNAGTGAKSVEVSGVTVGDGTNFENYDVEYEDNTSSTINKASLTVSTNSVTKTYDGTADTDSGTDASGMLATVVDGTLYDGDDLSGGTFTYADKNAATGTKHVEVSGVTVGDGTNFENYDVEYQDNTTSTINKATLTVSGVAAENRDYNGTLGATINNDDAEYDGLIGDDNVTTTGNFEDKNVGTNKTVNLSFGGTDGDNYTIIGQTTTMADIGKASLTLSTNNVTKTYDGTTDTGGTTDATGMQAAVVGGTLYDGDSLTGGTFSYADKNAGTGTKHVGVSGVTVGDGTNFDNYEVDYQDNTTSTINKASLTVSTNDVTKTYDSTLGTGGTTDATGMQAVVVDGTLYDGDSLTGGTFNYTDKNAGMSTKHVEVSDVTAGDGTNNDNYDIEYKDNTTSTINKASLTLSTNDVTKTYDGTEGTGDTTNASGMQAVVVDGFLYDGDELSGGTFTYDGKAAAYGVKHVEVSDVTVGDGTNFDNYNVDYQGNTTSTINKATLTVSGITAEGRGYNGTTDATINDDDAMFDGLIGDDDITTTGSFEDENAGTDKIVNLSFEGTDSGNYTFEGQDTATADISKASLTLSTSNVTKTYDSTVGTGGATDATGMQATVVDGTLYDGDELTGGTFNYIGKGAATGTKHVVVSGVSVGDGTNFDNYDVDYQDNTTSTINKATLTVSGVTAEGRSYNGTRDATVNDDDADYSGLIGEDSITTTGVFVDKNAGDNKIVNLSFGGTDGDNYTIAGQSTTTANISKASLTLSTNNVTKTYDSTVGTGGATNATGMQATVVEGVLYDGDSLTGGKFNYTDKNAATGTKHVEVSGVTIGDGTSNDNYDVEYQDNTTSTINKAVLTVSGIYAQNKVYDGNTDATVNVSAAVLNGMFEGDDVSLSATGQFNDSEIGDDKPVLVLASLYGTDQNNYELAAPGDFTADITEASVQTPTDPVPPVVPPTSQPLPGSTPSTPNGGDKTGSTAGPGGSGAGGGSNGSNGDKGSVSSFTLLNSPDDARANDDFISVRILSPQDIRVGASFSVVLPKDTFVHSDTSAVLTYDARLDDGSPLPDWLHFDPKELRFYGMAPDGATKVNVVVIAHDKAGHKAEAKLTLDVKP